jgi:hypothetical protein
MQAFTVRAFTVIARGDHGEGAMAPENDPAGRAFSSEVEAGSR